MRELFTGIVCIMLVANVYAGTTTWNGLGDATDWFDAANWDSGLPAAGDVAVINSGTVLLTNSTPLLSNLTMGGGILICSNWTTRITATNVNINAGTITLPVAFTNGMMSNRVWIVATNFTLTAGAIINVEGRGYAVQNGLGAPLGLDSVGPGGSYGGRGQFTCRTVQESANTHGSISAPTAPGSGGGDDTGSDGGGAVRIQAGTATINGAINANGEDGTASYGGGGSGGSIFISCNTFGGNATGLISADGGDANHGNINSGASGAGGGGRIAITYSSLSGSPAVRFSANAGTPKQNPFPIAIGTLYFSDDSFLSTGMSQILAGNVTGPGFTSWAVDSLTVTNGPVALGENAFTLTVTNDLTVSGATLRIGNMANVGESQTISIGGSVTLDGGVLTIGGTGNEPQSTMTVAGNLTVTNGSSFYVHSGPTNSSPDYGALVDITGNVSIAEGSWIHVTSHPTNGGSALFKMANLTIATNGGFNANSWYEGSLTKYWHRRGYDSATGTGAGTANYGSGGGHGGAGGDTTDASGGSAYDVTNAPVQPGSGGGRVNSNYAGGRGGTGGGTIRIEARNVVLNGKLTADGSDVITHGSTWGGGGAGGSIYIFCNSFQGDSGGVLSAIGGDGNSGTLPHTPGGGGGGRIAVWINVPEGERPLVLGGNLKRVSLATTNENFYGTISVTGGWANLSGSGKYGEVGSVVFLTFVPPSGTVITVR